jgi:hypothetical protein
MGCKVTTPIPFTDCLALSRERHNDKPGEEGCKDERRNSDPSHSF